MPLPSRIAFAVWSYTSHILGCMGRLLKYVVARNMRQLALPSTWQGPHSGLMGCHKLAFHMPELDDILVQFILLAA